jgi:hypothetical protein
LIRCINPVVKINVVHVVGNLFAHLSANTRHRARLSVCMVWIHEAKTGQRRCSNSLCIYPAFPIWILDLWTYADQTEENVTGGAILF